MTDYIDLVLVRIGNARFNTRRLAEAPRFSHLKEDDRVTLDTLDEGVTAKVESTVTIDRESPECRMILDCWCAGDEMPKVLGVVKPLAWPEGVLPDDEPPF